MEEIRLSIILPVYNSSKYIEKCLNSFVPFLKNHDELIIVEDCSKDNSIKILEDYIKRNKNKSIILLKNEQNIGAGLSKNRALEIAKGKYIGFIDSDDYVNEKYFQNMLHLALKNDSDIVISDIALAYDNEIIKNDIYINNIYNSNSKTNFSKEIILGNWACASTCSKLFKSSLIKDIRFSEKSSDDIIFSIKSLVKAKNITYCKDNYYFYYQSTNSLTRNNTYKKYKDSLNCLFEAVNYLYNIDKTYSKIYAANALFPSICYALDAISLEDIPKFLEIVKNNFCNQELKLSIIENKYLKQSTLYKSKKYRLILKWIKNNNYKYIVEYFKKKEIVKRAKPDNKDYLFKPLVSIIIPVFNGENYIEEAINSALSQTYKNIEIIIIDDGSTDNTETICRKYIDKIKYIKKNNGGVSSALNIGIENMQGEYFSWLSHDDLYFEDKIQKQIEFLNNQKEKNIILFGNYVFINENGRLIDKPIIINHNMTEKKPEYILLRGCINGITMLIPREAFNDIKFNESLRCTQDYDMWHKLMKKYKFIHMKYILSKTRIHSNQDTVVNPRVKSEGEKLWTYMIEEVPDERKKYLEGSIYNYYYKMAEHLKQSCYEDTYNKCIEKCKKINKAKYDKNPVSDFKEKSNLKKVIYCFRHYGPLYTIKTIIKKIIR